MSLAIQAQAPVPARYEALFRVSQAIGKHQDPKELFHVLAGELRRVVRFDYLSVLLQDEASNRLCWNVLDVADHGRVFRPAGLEAEDTMVWWAYRHQQPVLIPSVERETRFPRVMEFFRKEAIRSSCSLPLTTAHRRLGSLGFGSRYEDAYTEEEIRFLSLVADQVALAVDDALNLRQSQREKSRLRLLLDLNNSVVSNLELRELLRAISANVRRVMDCDAVGVALLEPGSGRLRIHAHDLTNDGGFIHDDSVFPIDGCPPGKAFRTGRPVVVGKADVSCFCPGKAAVADGLNSGCFLPLPGRDGILGALCLGRQRENAFTGDEVDFLSQVASQIAVAVENALAYRQIADLKDRLAREKLYLEDEIRSELNFEEIVGRSAALRRVLQQVETVAPTDSTVLICGETGSGKELVARAIHSLSQRRENAFVKLNCAAIPTGLLESELFGHEKGAFTGAVSQRIGRFELGSRGTVFLDEVGEIPLELQPKLLRVLQEREFERLGSSRTLRTDARLVAATNRDLAEMVAGQKFRTDLFYRLNVFPVYVPPLRERQEDIPILVRHFVEQFARRMHKGIDTIPSATMEALVRYPWPGNIRELQNLIERAVILTAGPVLKVPLADLKSRAPAGLEAARKTETMREAERKHILAALEETKWVLAGPNGAAARLGLKRSTLQFRMKKLGLSRPATP